MSADIDNQPDNEELFWILRRLSQRHSERHGAATVGAQSETSSGAPCAAV
jgi:hypothetical protein